MHVLWPLFWKHQIKAKSLVILPNQGIAYSKQHSRTRKVRPQRVAARRQKELLCPMVFQELEWHAVKYAIRALEVSK